MSTYKVRVDYYNDGHKKALEKYPNFKSIDQFVGTTVEFEKSEFLTYAVFTEQSDNNPGYKTFKELARKVKSRRAVLKDYFTLQRNTITVKNGISKKMRPSLIEDIGVAGSLCLIGRIHNLTDADWQKIPETTTQRTLDYEIASDGERIVFVESKGSISDDNKLKSSVSNHKASIEEKKRQLPNREEKIAYGVITVISRDQHQPTQCWLLDPPTSESVYPPYKHKLLARLYYYWSSLKTLYPHAGVLHALINKIKIIANTEHYMELDSLPLVDINGNKIKFPPTSYSDKSIVDDTDIVGDIIPIDDDKLLFLGYSKDIFDLLVDQKFSDIISYKKVSTTRARNITCKIKKSYVQKDNEEKIDTLTGQYPLQYQINSVYMKNATENQYFYEIDLEATLYTSSSGRTFGIIELDQVKNH